MSSPNIRGGDHLAEETRMFCAGAMISVGLFLALVCVALRGAAVNAKNLLGLLDRICERYDAWMNPELLPTQAPATTKSDTESVTILLVPHLAELSVGCAGSIASRYNELAKGAVTTTAIRLPRSLSAGNLRIRSPPMTPQFTDRTDFFVRETKQSTDV